MIKLLFLAAFITLGSCQLFGLFGPPKPAQFTTKFNLYTRNNKQTAQVLTSRDAGNLAAITKTNFKGSLMTRFIVHGFVDTTSASVWMGKMKDAFLDAGDCNVFIVDWSAGNGFLSYDQSASGLSVANVHILGHSLGAHIAGYAGQAFNGQLGRITGFDPAGPGYAGKDTKDKLNPSNAQFVDAIHTDTFPLIGLGINENSGHVDFYPNGGHDQPGCVINRLGAMIDNGLYGGFACSHFRSVEFYTASLNPNNPKGVATQCSDYSTYLSGDCDDSAGANGGTVVLGEQAILAKPYESITVGNKYYLATGAFYPFFETK
ncbi:unnamed protein product [Medioppia subpectinata]|uniref:Lipase domain-containing protein n=1 Tax=Medioppia subpectinata TaxID=1979941 RepID=A0A7R9PV06_9ACAR|nr:unnamed protein product [Medioppia subpectinata]CAG2102317.1 unnamed protein product [Medioppia subpectinata]